MNLDYLNIDLKILDDQENELHNCEMTCQFDQQLSEITDEILQIFDFESGVNVKVKYLYKKRELDPKKKIYNYFQFFQDQYLLTSSIPLKAILIIKEEKEEVEKQIKKEKKIKKEIINNYQPIDLNKNSLKQEFEDTNERHIMESNLIFDYNNNNNKNINSRLTKSELDIYNFDNSYKKFNKSMPKHISKRDTNISITNEDKKNYNDIKNMIYFLNQGEYDKFIIFLRKTLNFKNNYQNVFFNSFLNFYFDYKNVYFESKNCKVVQDDKNPENFIIELCNLSNKASLEYKKNNYTLSKKLLTKSLNLFLQNSIPKKDLIYPSILLNKSLINIKEKNFIEALDILKNCSKYYIEINISDNEKSFYLSKCYFLISLCLFYTNKIEEAGNILNKAMKFLFEAKKYDIVFLNKYISLLFLIDSKNGKMNQSLANYLKHFEKLKDLPKNIFYSHENLIFFSNLLSVLKTHNIENPFKECLEDTIEFLFDAFNKLIILKFDMKKKFIEISEDLLYFLFYKLDDLIQLKKNEDIENILSKICYIFDQQNYLTKKIQKFQIDYFNIKAFLVCKDNSDESMRYLSKAIEISKNFPSNNPVHEKLLKNLNLFNTIS